MDFQQEQTESPEINLAPLIDVVFILLIFFMVTTTFKENESEIQINLPEATTGAPKAHKGFKITISVDSVGRYYVNDIKLAKNDRDYLYDRLQKLVKGKKYVHIIINADRNAPYQYVMTAMNVTQLLKVNKMNLGISNAGDAN